MGASVNQTPRAQLARLVEETARLGVLRRLVFAKPLQSDRVKAVLSVVSVKGKAVFQLETFHADNKAKQTNIPPERLEKTLQEELERWQQADLITGLDLTCEWKRSREGKETLLGAPKLMSSLLAYQPRVSKPCTPKGTPAKSNTADLSPLPAPKPLPISTHDRQKKHILSGSEPFLKLLGVSDENGRVFDKKQSKFRQINRFLELLRDVEDKLPAQGPIHVCDLCCGKSYLSFAVYHYLTAVLGREVRMFGVDLKEDVVSYCNEVAERLHYSGLRFTAGDVGAFEPAQDVHIHLVVSLHACDTATDLVLHKAIAWKSEVILSTPCCHHELNHTLDCPELAAVARYSMLRQKLCDAATDAMRLLLLEAEGYATEALELIDPEETPKNILLRAVRHPQSAAAQKRAREAYADAVRFFLRTPGDAQDTFLSRDSF